MIRVVVHYPQHYFRRCRRFENLNTKTGEEFCGVLSVKKKRQDKRNTHRDFFCARKQQQHKQQTLLRYLFLTHDRRD